MQECRNRAFPLPCQFFVSQINIRYHQNYSVYALQSEPVPAIEQTQVRYVQMYNLYKLINDTKLLTVFCPFTNYSNHLYECKFNSSTVGKCLMCVCVFVCVQVYLKAPMILNGVCVIWRGWIDLQRLDGMGCLEYDDERAQVWNVAVSSHNASPTHKHTHMALRHLR